MELVDEYKLILIEDCAQAHGAKYKGKMPVLLARYLPLVFILPKI